VERRKGSRSRTTEDVTDLAVNAPLRIRVRGDSDRCFVEWEALNALMQIARRSSRDIEVECITPAGARVVLSLV